MAHIEVSRLVTKADDPVVVCVSGRNTQMEDVQSLEKQSISLLEAVWIDLLILLIVPMICLQNTILSNWPTTIHVYSFALYRQGHGCSGDSSSPWQQRQGRSGQGKARSASLAISTIEQHLEQEGEKSSRGSGEGCLPGGSLRNMPCTTGSLEENTSISLRNTIPV